jgi:hypothetical protein
MRVLLLEKRQAVADLFVQAAPDTTIARTVDEAAAALDKLTFDLICLDRDGLALARRFIDRTAKGLGIPILVYSIDLINVGRITKLLPYAQAHPLTLISSDLKKYLSLVSGISECAPTSGASSKLG